MKSTKTSTMLFITSSLLVLVLLAAPNARADETALASILKERDSILSKLVAEQETRLAQGMLFDPAELDSARLALWTFRRDTAKTSDEKIKQQELIVTVYEKQLELVKARYDTGTATRGGILTATDALLQAKQTLEELKLAATPQTPAPAPPEAAPAGKNQPAPNAVTIVIQKDGSLLFNGKQTTKDQLAQLLSKTKTINRNDPVLVSMDENIPVETLNLVMETCRKEGINKISLQTR